MRRRENFAVSNNKRPKNWDVGFRMKKWWAVGVFFVGMVSACGTTFAQELGQGDGVMDRARPEYDAKGLPLGGFRLFPVFDGTAGYDDNILRQQSAPDVINSIFFKEDGSLMLRSNWGRHELDLFGGADTVQYLDLSSENNTNWNVGGNGRLDIARGSSLTASTTYATEHEPRTSPNQPSFAAKPTQFTDLNSQAALDYHPYHFDFMVGGSYDRKVYDPTAVNAPGTPINNTDRDEDVYNVFAKAAYEFSPGYAAFFKVNYNDRAFDQLLDRNGLNRASNGFEYTGGLDLMLSHLLKGELFVGYLDQKFKSPLPNVSGVDFGANLDWYATELFTVHLTASRTVADTTFAGTSALDSRQGGISFDWEVARNIIVQGNFGYTDMKFTGITRDDQITDAGIGAKYLLNRYMSADVKYRFERRSTNVTGQNYNDNLVTVGLTLHL